MKRLLFLTILIFSGICFAHGDSATNNVFYSVGQSTSDLMAGTGTVTIISGAAVFTVAQTGNIGVGGSACSSML